MERTSLSGPLHGIRVLDFSSIIAGPMATLALASLGAEIIKVERMDGGDEGRFMGPHLGPWSSTFVPLNRGKKSIAVDITKPAGRDVILRLASKIDVVIQNLRVGKMEKLGLGEDAFRKQNPTIIYASLSAFGDSGPDSQKPGYEALVQGRTGIISVTGLGPGSPPVRAGVPIIDGSTGLWLALGILAALFDREKSGEGQRVNTSLLESGVLMMFHNLAGQQFSGANPIPQGSRYPVFGDKGGAFGPYGAYETADGWIMLGVSNDRIFRRLCTALDRPEWADDPGYSTNLVRLTRREELDAEMQKLLRKKTTAQWAAIFDTNEVPWSAIQEAEQVLTDPQVEALHQLDSIKLPGQGDRVVKVPRIPLQLSRTPVENLGSVPLLGEHGREILAEIGYSDAEVASLVEAGICKL